MKPPIAMVGATDGLFSVIEHEGQFDGFENASIFLPLPGGDWNRHVPGLHGDAMRGQSRRMSFGEVCFSTAVGFAVNFVLQMFLYPQFNFHPGFGGNVLISVVFTAASVIRGWFTRRLFNWWDHREP